MRAGPGELEVLVPLGEAGTDAAVARPPFDGNTGRKSGRRRTTLLRGGVLVALVAVVIVAVPVRHELARRELHWLDSQWAQAQADDDARVIAEQNLEEYLAVAAPAQVYPAESALFRQESQRLADLRGRLGRAVLVDHGLSVLRGKIDTALVHRASLLAISVAWYLHPTGDQPPENADRQTVADSVAVDFTLSTERLHWGQAQPVEAAPAAAYPAAVTALARLSRWLDQPVGSVLLAGSGDHLTRLDVDASRIDDTAVDNKAPSPTPRQGYLAYATGGQVWAVTPDGSPPPRRLAAGDFVYGAVDPTAVWVGNGMTWQVTEVNGDGRVLAGPVQPPGMTALATSAGLVVYPSDAPAIEVWNPTTGRVTCRMLDDTGNGPSAIAAWGNELAWSSGDGQLHMTNVTTCVDQVRGAIVNILPGFAQGVGAFSPDGKTLAVAAQQTGAIGGGPFPLVLIDVATGHTTAIPAASAPGPIGAVAWTADSSRLFWLYDGERSSPTLIATWRVGAASSQTLRAIDLSITAPLLVVP